MEIPLSPVAGALTHIMRILCAVLLAVPFCMLAQGASPANEIVHDDPFTGFRFPRGIAGYAYQNKVQYPRVGLGYGLNYVDRAGATATVIVYDLNQSGIVDGIAEMGVRQQFEELDRAVTAEAQQRGYRAVQRIQDIEPLSKAWLQANHELVRADGRRAFSYSFIRAQNGRYVKIRITAPTNANYQRLPLFLLGVSRAIGMMSGEGKPSEARHGGSIKPAA